MHTERTRRLLMASVWLRSAFTLAAERSLPSAAKAKTVQAMLFSDPDPEHR